MILPPPDLESRQSLLKSRAIAAPFCPPRIWNQGKAGGPGWSLSAEFCPPRIWNQGKADRKAPRLTHQFCPPRIWNQGKASGRHGR